MQALVKIRLHDGRPITYETVTQVAETSRSITVANKFGTTCKAIKTRFQSLRGDDSRSTVPGRSKPFIVVEASMVNYRYTGEKSAIPDSVKLVMGT